MTAHLHEAAEQRPEVAAVAASRHADHRPLGGPGAAEEEQEDDERQAQVRQNPEESLDVALDLLDGRLNSVVHERASDGFARDEKVVRL